jgi:Tfp pilus assembly protein PilN
VYDRTTVDLVPEEIKLKKSLQERGRDLMKTGVLILSIFVLLFTTLIGKIYFRSAYFEKLKKEYNPLDAEARQLEDSFSKVSWIKQYLKGRGRSLEVLVELFEIAPESLALSDIRFDAEGKFILKGSADAMQTVFTFVDNIKSSKYFVNVQTKNTTKRKEGAVDIVDFEISASLKKQNTNGA